MAKTRPNTTMTDKQKETQEKIKQEAEKINLNISCMRTNYIQGSLNGENLAPEQFPEYAYPIRFYCECCETPMKSEAELKKHIVREKHKNERNKKDYVSQLELENKFLREKLLKYESPSVEDFIDDCEECEFVFVAKEHLVGETTTEIYTPQAPMCFHEFFFHFKMWCKSKGCPIVPNKKEIQDEMYEWQRRSKWGLSLTHIEKDSYFFRNGSNKNFRINLKPKNIMKEYVRELDDSRKPHRVSGWLGDD